MIHKIKTLYDNGEGSSIRSIAEKLKISRNTVKKYLRKKEEEICNLLSETERSKKLDSYDEYIIHLLEKYPRLSAIKVMRKLKAKSSDITISDRTLRRHISKLKETISLKQQRYYEPVLDMVPGVQCQVDPGEIRNVIVGGKEITLYFVAFVLSYSRLIFVSVSDRPIDTPLFIRMHNEAFSYFDGVVEECVYDQTKLVVIKEEFREVWFNNLFYQYATTAGFDIRVCEGYDPESKGKVESVVKYVKNNFFYGEEFSSFNEIKDKLSGWVNVTANRRTHGTTAKLPFELYESREKSKMKPYLRASRFYNVVNIVPDDSSNETRQVDKTSLISYRSNKYSVPMQYQSSRVFINIEGQSLVVSDIKTGKEIARHEINCEKGKILKNINHYRDHQKRISDHEQAVSKIVGDNLSKDICTLIQSTSPKIYKDQLVGLLKILNKYESSEILIDTLNHLKTRQRLTATMVRDYLSAAVGKTDREDTTSPLIKITTNKLNGYSAISKKQKEVSRAWN